ncbi:hypothetical protein CHS0354_036028 [Potamilus streckersoni]|uniref:Cytochrome c oxidase assembly protein COX20, mitochondrial n=1 Tax=Potamilus streckersoni TaxID=2493646 RepID=A0AAE0RMJ5_9BIVA|nr:hypothetical protein CHS0354_036028 [Potamilus streckersoni]
MSETSADESSKKKSVMFFKTDLAKIPCFKSSFLNAIGGGASGFIVTLFLTSDPTRSHRYGFTTFILVACGSWIFCRYHYTKQLIDTNKINKAIAERSKKTILQIDNVDVENVAKKS